MSELAGARVVVRRLLCRFSDAGKGSLDALGGRRPKSAKARNRGK
jgi:hypothetical protein